jgi:hypothetical protein
MRLVLVVVGFAGFVGCGGAGAPGNTPDLRDSGASDGAVDVSVDAPDSSREARLAAARLMWANAKPDCPVYHYSRYHLSFTGFEATTTIEIANDRPARRSYVSVHDRFGNSDAGPQEKWDEVGSEVGSHTAGDPALTVEQIETLCDSIVAQNPREDVTVDINREGVPVACWFVPKNCADDCGMGFGADFACGPLAIVDGGVGQD